MSAQKERRGAFVPILVDNILMILILGKEETEDRTLYRESVHWNKAVPTWVR
jgi:hypothetical protein